MREPMMSSLEVKVPRTSHTQDSRQLLSGTSPSQRRFSPTQNTGSVFSEPIVDEMSSQRFDHAAPLQTQAHASLKV